MKYALVYGSIAGLVVIAVIVASLAADLPNHATSEWLGYLVMLVAMSLIFVGVKRYRDIECGGVIRFGRALGLGTGIAAVAGVIYVIGWEVNLAVSGRDFMAEYSRGAPTGPARVKSLRSRPRCGLLPRCTRIRSCGYH
jgi:hypothetical protein